MTKAKKLLLLGLVFSGGLTACGSAGTEDVEVTDSDVAKLTAENSTYFALRPDLRRCVSPLCGGFFVKAVNQPQTLCADGTSQAECYVAELDLSALGLSSGQQDELRGDPSEFLLRGSVNAKTFPAFGNLGVFHASEAWRGHDGVVPSGTFLRANSTGTVCITFPCPIISAAVLNTNAKPLSVAELDLSGISKDPSDGFAQLNEPEGLLVAATKTVVTGPAGRAIGLDASEYYLPFEGKTKLCGSRGLPECDPDMFCDFPPESSCGQADLPGVCEKKPVACTQQHDPVCGCDGQTYGNACHANAAGVSVDHRGACDSDPEPRVCGTIVGLTCEKGEYCDFGVGQCNVSDAAGVCQPVSPFCQDIYSPVCGCDGKTYGNACYAAAAGAQIDHKGECP